MNTKTKKLVTAALFAAFACVATMIIQIPITVTKGYINLGDCIVLLAGYMLGPVYGGAAAGIGTALADIISSYTVYAPATFIIKFLMALCAGSIFRFGASKPYKAVIAAALGEIIMVLGYFIYECFLTGSIATAAVGILGNSVQAVAGVVISSVLAILLSNVKEIRRFFTE